MRSPQWIGGPKDFVIFSRAHPHPSADHVRHIYRGRRVQCWPLCRWPLVVKKRWLSPPSPAAAAGAVVALGSLEREPRLYALIPF